MIALPRLRQVDRLIGASVLGSLIVTWLLLVGFDAFTQLVRQLAHVGENGYTVAQAFLYVALTVPRRASETFGFAAMIGALLGVGALAATSELTALRAAGMSRARIAFGALGWVAVALLAALAIGETVAPIGEQRAQAMQLARRADELGLTTRSGLWARDGTSIVNAKVALAQPRGGRTEIELREVRIFEFDAADKLVSFTRAASARSENRVWQLQGARRTRFDATGAHSEELERMDWTSSLNPRLLELSVVRPDYLKFSDLRRNIRHFRANGQDPGAYAEAYWARLFAPLNTLLLVLAALPFAFGSMRSGGLGKRIFIGIILAVAWHFLQLGLVSIGGVYGLKPWLAQFLPAPVLGVLALLLFRRRG